MPALLTSSHDLLANGGNNDELAPGFELCSKSLPAGDE
jgi:hypothetical protein